MTAKAQEFSKPSDRRPLIAQEEKLSMIIESIKDYAIFMLDPEGYVTTWNAGAKKMKGYEASEIIGRHFSVFYPEKDKKTKAQHELNIAKEAGRFEDEDWRIRKDGTTFWANVILNAIYDPSGELVGYAKITRDLTERKIAEENRLRVEAQRAQMLATTAALQSRDEFLSIASHELKTPLTSLKLQTQIRTREVKRGDFRRFEHSKLLKLLADDEKQINRLIRLVDDMLDISRIQTGKLSFTLEEFDLSELIQDALSRYSSQIESHDSKVTFVHDGPSVGTWDRFRIEQVFVNLLTNALKYGEGAPVEIKLSKNNALVRLTVHDSGLGIAKADQQRIFERFERAIDGNSISGLGLGLFISKRIVEAHQGKIYVESEKGEGATFIVELPLAKEGK